MQIAWLVLTDEYFVPRIAQIIRIRSAGGRRREQGLINDGRLFTHYIFSAVFIKLRKFLMIELITDY